MVHLDRHPRSRDSWYSNNRRHPSLVDSLRRTVSIRVATMVLRNRRDPCRRRGERSRDERRPGDRVSGGTLGRTAPARLDSLTSNRNNMDRRFSDRRQRNEHPPSTRPHLLRLLTSCRNQRRQPFSTSWYSCLADRDDVSVPRHTLVDHLGHKLEQPRSESHQVVRSLPSYGRVDHGCVWKVEVLRVESAEHTSQRCSSKITSTKPCSHNSINPEPIDTAIEPKPNGFIVDRLPNLLVLPVL